MFFSCVGIADVLVDRTATIYTLNVKVMLVVAIILCIIEIGKRSKKAKEVCFVIICCFLMSNWLITSYVTYKEGCLSWAENSVPLEEELAEQILEMGIEDDLYYYIPEGRHNIEYLQFLIGDASIKCFDNIEDLPKGAYVVTTTPSKFAEELGENYQRIGWTAYVSLWEPVDVAK